jgi:hypothetical protein
MKTGRLIKFSRPGGDVQAYIYHGGASFEARLYVLAPDQARPGEPAHSLSAPTEADVERAVRDWVAIHFPKP